MKKHILIFMFIGFLLLNVMVVSATSNLNLEVNLVNNQKKALDLEDINIENQLVFELILSNVGNYWICSNHLSYRLDITRSDGKTFDPVMDTLISSSNYKQDKICFAPNSKFTLWIPYEDYNNLEKIQTLREKEDRIGDWYVKPGISLGSNPNCYTASDITKGACSEELKRNIPGNPLNFNVRQDTASTYTEWDNLKKWFDKLWSYWVLFIGAGVVVIITIVYFIIKKK